MEKHHKYLRFSSSQSVRALPILLLILTALLTFLPLAKAIPTTVSVNPSSVTANVGQNFNINVTVLEAIDLYGWEFRLSWNASLIDVVTASEGSFLKSGGGNTYFQYSTNNTAGRMVADGTLLGMVPGITGNGVLATITFNVKGAGNSPLNLYNVILVDSANQVIQTQVVSGAGYFLPPHDVAVTGVTVSPMLTVIGNTVTANVTAEAQGGYSEWVNITAYANSNSIGKQNAFLQSGASTSFQFVWNTTGYSKGDYVILASASTVSGETNVANNNRTGGTVTLLYPGHDVAVIAVASTKTVVGQGFATLVEATVKNYGIYTETLNVTAYVNTTAIGTQSVILLSANYAILPFLWNTTSFNEGNYILKASAQAVPGETYVTDNILVGGRTKVTIPGDVDGNSEVNILDVVKITMIYSSSLGNPQFDSNSDINGDGAITILDVVICTSHYGQKH